MTFKSPSVSRRTERAALRRGPPWGAWDILLPLAITLLGLLAALVPGVLADIGDTVIGSEWYVPELGASVSGIIAAFARWVLVGSVGVMLLLVREAPLPQRQAWTVVAVGILMNLARNVYTGNGATLSFLVIQAGLLWLLWRLSTRPTVWQQWQEERQRAEAAEASCATLTQDNARLDADNLRLRDEVALLRLTLGRHQEHG